MYAVADSLEFIERDYVFVNSRFGSTDTICSSVEASVRDISELRHSDRRVETTSKSIAVQKQAEELSISAVCDGEKLGSHRPVPLAASRTLIDSVDAGSLHSHPSMRLRSLHQYVHALSELAKEKVCISKCSSHDIFLDQVKILYFCWCLLL